jgi:hypothetical protein
MVCMGIKGKEKTATETFNFIVAVQKKGIFRVRFYTAPMRRPSIIDWVFL